MERCICNDGSHESKIALWVSECGFPNMLEWLNKATLLRRRQGPDSTAAVIQHCGTKDLRDDIKYILEMALCLRFLRNAFSFKIVHPCWH